MFLIVLLCKGCYEGGRCDAKCDNLVNNTVGNCYSRCKSKTSTEGVCADTEHFYFALQVTEK